MSMVFAARLLRRMISGQIAGTHAGHLIRAFLFRGAPCHAAASTWTTPPAVLMPWDPHFDILFPKEFAGVRILAPPMGNPIGNTIGNYIKNMTF